MNEKQLCLPYEKSIRVKKNSIEKIITKLLKKKLIVNRITQITCPKQRKSSSTLTNFLWRKNMNKTKQYHDITYQINNV